MLIRFPQFFTNLNKDKYFNNQQKITKRQIYNVCCFTRITPTSPMVNIIAEIQQRTDNNPTNLKNSVKKDPVIKAVANFCSSVTIIIT